MAAKRADDFRAGDKDFADVGVRDEIEIALAVAGLDVFEAVPFFGQDEQDFGKECQDFDVDAQFAGFGAEEIAGDANDVAEVEQFITACRPFR